MYPQEQFIGKDIPVYNKLIEAGNGFVGHQNLRREHVLCTWHDGLLLHVHLPKVATQAIT
jgi:hypothetical protein